MINFLSNWIEQIAIAVIITSIFEMILPSGNIKKYIKMILGIYIVFNIISPFLNSDILYRLSNLSVESYAKDLEMETNSKINQQSMDLRLKDLYIEQIETNIKNRVGELGFVTEKCQVEANLDQNSSNAGINRINLILKEKEDENSVQKVQVNEIVISKILKFKDDENSEKANEVKKNLSEFYEVDEDIINVKIKQ